MEKKVDIKFINNIHKKILGNLKPNLTFVLKVSSNSSKKDYKKEKLKIDMIIFQNHFIQSSKIFYENC